MCPPTTTLPLIGFDSANEEIFTSLERMAHGCPLPPNVIVDVNPYNYAPSNLPEGIWFLIHSKGNEPAEFGFWKVKGEACKLFSNTSIIGWRTTLEFFEGQAPYEHKTDWIMQEYWLTQKGLKESSKVKEGSSICRVFLGGEQGLDHQRKLKLPSLDIDNYTFVHSTRSIVSNAQDFTNSGSTSKNAVEKDDEIGNLDLTGESENLLEEIRPDNDYLSRGDYLELLDLDEPASPSSSSDNSSCVTMSSDECFDSLALLKELDSEINPDSVQKDEHYNFNISTSLKPNDMVMAPASPGAFISVKATTKEFLGSDSVQPGLADGPSNSDDVGTSSNSAKRRKKKLKNKYFCFMPLYFLF